MRPRLGGLATSSPCVTLTQQVEDFSVNRRECERISAGAAQNAGGTWQPLPRFCFQGLFDTQGYTRHQ